MPAGHDRGRLEDSGQVYKANRAANVCSMIMRFAVATGNAESDPIPALNGSLKRHPRKHMAAMIDPKEVGRLLRTIDAYGGSFTVRSALQIAPYVFVRPTELRHARWEDIDFEAREWRYTATKTKPSISSRLPHKSWKSCKSYVPFPMIANGFFRICGGVAQWAGVQW